NCVGDSTQFAILGDTPNELGHHVFQELARGPDKTYASLRDTVSDSLREISAGGAGMKATLFEDLDLLGGLRLERIRLESNNNAFTGEISPITHIETIYPTTFLMFERLDNLATGEITQPVKPGTFFNDQILGLKVPVNPVTHTVDLTSK